MKTECPSGQRTRQMLILLRMRVLVSRVSIRRALLAAPAGAVVVLVAIALLHLFSSSVSVASSSQHSMDMSLRNKLNATQFANITPVSDETCERHCARTRNEFGCVLAANSTIDVHVTRPLDSEKCAAGCRCLHAELLCDRRTDCRDGSDEWPDKCAHYTGLITCGSSDFKCAKGSALMPLHDRHSFCIPKSARCDRRFDCEDFSDEQNCTSALTTRTGSLQVHFIISPLHLVLLSICY